MNLRLTGLIDCENMLCLKKEQESSDLTLDPQCCPCLGDLVSQSMAFKRQIRITTSINSDFQKGLWAFACPNVMNADPGYHSLIAMQDLNTGGQLWCVTLTQSSWYLKLICIEALVHSRDTVEYLLKWHAKQLEHMLRWQFSFTSTMLLVPLTSPNHDE